MTEWSLDPGLVAVAFALAVSTGDGAEAPVAVRLLEADLDDTGNLHVTLAAPADRAIVLARLAALDGLVLVGLPPSPGTEDVG